jgi:hypothetical protein
MAFFTRRRVPDLILVAFAAAIGGLAVATRLGRGAAFMEHAGGRLTTALLAALALLLVSALRLEWERRARLALVLTSTTLALYLPELLIAPRLGLRRQELIRLRRTEPTVVAGIAPASFLARQRAALPALSADGRPIFPLAGVSRVPTLDCREDEGWIVYTSDEHGFRNPPGLWRAPADVVLLGDSFGHGQCVADGHTIADRVRARHPATLSLAYAGDGPLTALATLREAQPLLRPRVVVWLYFPGNDLWDMSVEAAHPILRRYREDVHFRQDVLALQPAVDQGLRAVAERAQGPTRPSVPWRNVLLLRNLRNRIALGPSTGGSHAPHFGSPFHAPTQREVTAFAAVLRQAKVEVEGGGGRLLFVYLPAWTELLPPRPDERLLRDRVLAAVRGTGVAVVDVLESFAAAEDPADLFACARSCHYNARGYALAAERILAALPSLEARAR